MADFVVHDGTEIDFDLYQIKRNEYLKLNRGEFEDEEIFELMARVTGKPAKFFEDFNWIDWRKMFITLHDLISSAVGENEKSKN